MVQAVWFEHVFEINMVVNRYRVICDTGHLLCIVLQLG